MEKLEKQVQEYVPAIYKLIFIVLTIMSAVALGISLLMINGKAFVTYSFEFLKTIILVAVLKVLAPCQLGSHPDSHAYKLIIIL